MNRSDKDRPERTPTHDPRAQVFIGLGSNLGALEDNLALAQASIVNWPGITYQTASKVYVTQPQDRPDQPWFANQVLRVACDATWTPLKLLRSLKDLEVRLGRASGERFGPRLIDCDLLLFGEVVVDTPELVLPHPRLRERAFVLVPLVEIAGDLAIPGGPSAAQALRRLPHAVRGHRILQPWPMTDEEPDGVSSVPANSRSEST